MLKLPRTQEWWLLLAVALKTRWEQMRRYFVPGVGRPLSVINFSYQVILRLDSDCPYQKHFTSRVIHPQGLRFSGNDIAQRRSLAASGGCYINSTSGVTIGEGTIWAPNVCILAQDHDASEIANNVNTEPTVIGDYCWIGFGAVIMPGVILGSHTIVGANAVVTKSYPLGNLHLVGAPARPVVKLKQGDTP